MIDVPFGVGIGKVWPWALLATRTVSAAATFGIPITWNREKFSEKKFTRAKRLHAPEETCEGFRRTPW